MSFHITSQSEYNLECDVSTKTGEYRPIDKLISTLPLFTWSSRQRHTAREQRRSDTGRLGTTRARNRAVHLAAARAMTDIASFASSQLSLLDKELQAELAETQLLTSTHAPNVLQRAGLAVLNLSVTSQRTGLGGKTVLELGVDPAVGATELPEHGLRVGDICAVAEQPKGAERKKEREGMEKSGVEGVVTKLHRDNVTVALDKEDADVPGGKLWLYVSGTRR